jgi:hypothetical protein
MHCQMILMVAGGASASAGEPDLLYAAGGGASSALSAGVSAYSCSCRLWCGCSAEDSYNSWLLLNIEQ